ncbi:PAS/PAC sensor-containing diguanylate cyclase [Candidatus Magnetobacterium bavaricum]|uniref:PAS/PAC sensor-containing diguanylate cyclase n=1 Tax=Candidatus Magnetobacterium bavaricum TaxID=29290 RepID=A0A0F3GKB8_9BACT|nr:PAS/PAC sensor-containing diguanylate cyclase [Candidatus Magnetobacterium bavaricum]
MIDNSDILEDGDILQDTDILEELFDGVCIVDRGLTIIFWNRAAEMITGFNRKEMLGKPFTNEILNPITYQGESFDKDKCLITRTLADGIKRTENLFFQHKRVYRMPVSQHITPLKNDTSEIVAAAVIFKDSSSRLLFMQRNADIVNIDSVTEVANRSFIDMMLHTKFNELRSYGESFAIVLIDIDHYKNIKAIFGNAVAEMALKMVSMTLLKCSRNTDIIGRWGEVELIVIIPNVNEYQLNVVTNRFRMLIEKTRLLVGTRVVPITISLGAAIAQPVDNEATIIKRTDMLLEDSRQMGGNTLSL